jgi:hypothetical protein
VPCVAADAGHEPEQFQRGKVVTDFLDAKLKTLPLVAYVALDAFTALRESQLTADSYIVCITPDAHMSR